MSMPKAGDLYRHYKGNEYRIIALAKNEADLAEVVVYQDVHDPTGVWVRPLAVFMEEVVVDGVQQPRFKYVEECL